MVLGCCLGADCGKFVFEVVGLVDIRADPLGVWVVGGWPSLRDRWLGGGRLVGELLLGWVLCWRGSVGLMWIR